MYQALYRKWRPKTFDDVVGQEHITDTLKRQVASGRLSHAYLFTGTRGTGKTTCAKILARAVNCENPQDGNPCNACPACLGIENGSILDVLELDAASNNGVDQVRALRDEGASYKYLPPARFIELQPEPIERFREVLSGHGIPYIECATWSTDGFYRETREMVAYRREEGCRAVEMECATMAAIAQFRGKVFGQLLYSGDILIGGAEDYDDRGWNNNVSARERLFALALEALCKL